MKKLIILLLVIIILCGLAVAGLRTQIGQRETFMFQCMLKKPTGRVGEAYGSREQCAHIYQNIQQGIYL